MAKDEVMQKRMTALEAQNRLETIRAIMEVSMECAFLGMQRRITDPLIDKLYILMRNHLYICNYFALWGWK